MGKHDTTTPDLWGRPPHHHIPSSPPPYSPTCHPSSSDEEPDTVSSPQITLSHPPPPDDAGAPCYSSSHVSSMSAYLSLYRESISSPSAFWLRMSKSIFFKTPPPTLSIFHHNFDTSKGPVFTRFMPDATTNVSFNCVDRHVANGLENKVAIYWEGNECGVSEELTYGDLLSRVCRFANGLSSLGVTQGDVVSIYMPSVPEIAIAMLACTRIGAIHSVIFAGFSAESLADRLVDGNVRVLVTADGSFRGTKLFNLKQTCDEALKICLKSYSHKVAHCVVLRHLEKRTPNNELLPPLKLDPLVDVCWDELTSRQSPECPPVWVKGEHPLFILYTSGSSGRPKGMVHTTAGYLVNTAVTAQFTFDFRRDDVFWGTSDMGWCAAHTNMLYGPLVLGGTTLLLEGTPLYPSPSRPWSLIRKYNVTQFLTAPTVLRHLIKANNDPIVPLLPSLRVLSSVGEPLHPSVRDWFFTVVGSSRCPIVDIYGQTETGVHVLTAIPGTTPPHKHIQLPFFGVSPTLVPAEGTNTTNADEGCLVLTQAWPSLARAINGDHLQERYHDAYFIQVPGAYFTGDAARRDGETGGFTILGRVDDMLNVSGHLISTSQVEAALMTHPRVSESCVVSVPHEVKGQSLAAFVVLKDECSDAGGGLLLRQLETTVREKVGSFAVPDSVVLTPALPLTRSGKVLKRILTTLFTSSSRDLLIESLHEKEPAAMLAVLADTSIVPTLVQAIRNAHNSHDERNFISK